MNARGHALHASKLLAGAAALSDMAEAMTAEQRLQAAVSGGFKQINEDLRWTVALAQAHATVALALTSTDPEGG